MFSVSFFLLVIISAVLALGLSSKIYKKHRVFSSKSGNFIYLFVLYFIAIGFCYLLFPRFLDDLSNQLSLEVRQGEIIDVTSVWDESLENHKQVVTAKTIIVSEIIQEIDQSPFSTYNIGDPIKLVYNEEKDKLIEVSLSSKITSSLFVLSCVLVFIIIISSILYILGSLSGERILKKIELLALYVIVPFIFLGIITICSTYIIKFIFHTVSSENGIVYLVLSIFFLILFSWVSWAYYKVVIRKTGRK
ncbi:hypothetical protein [uncultured Aquimarina sp.]|uniref:hypothetical protein n=1 Tax=uncultured Aquimarina sp. TaxID=575652 RepID=UPI0026247D84|nr:hypothetical protein [uncultured Aquimarina sp.]